MLWYYKGTGETRVHIVPASKSRTLVETDPTQSESPLCEFCPSLPGASGNSWVTVKPSFASFADPTILASFLSPILLFGHLTWTAWRG